MAFTNVFYGHNLSEQLREEAKLKGNDVYRIKRLRLPVRLIITQILAGKEVPHFVSLLHLDLSDDWRVVQITQDIGSICLSVYIWSMSFPVVGEMEIPPDLDGVLLSEWRMYALATDEEVFNRRSNPQHIDAPQPIITHHASTKKV